MKSKLLTTFLIFVRLHVGQQQAVLATPKEVVITWGSDYPNGVIVDATSAGTTIAELT